jgi:NAD(P)-dependent dehydrogenase (short-subunit alcohol dehydrogenase family)
MGEEAAMNVLESFSLSGRVAVVTGGAGLYGRQIVEALAEAGAYVFTASRSLAALEQQAAGLRERGLQVEALQLDLAREASILAACDAVIAHAGRVDVLVNNAVLRPMRGNDDPVERWEESIKVNVTGLFLITRAFGEAMAAAGRGSIINVSSIQGMVGPDAWLYEEVPWHGFVPDYFFHKGGMINFTRYMASLLGPKGVRVNTVSPGGFFNYQDEGFLWRYEKRTFLGRMANDTDLKGAVVYLASDASAYVTGANLVVDGGYTAK